MRRSGLVVALFTVGCAAGSSSGSFEPTDAEESASAEAELAAWSFEAASPSCNGWTARKGRAIRAAPPHSGSYACKLCASAGGAAELSVSLGDLSGGRYVVSAWVRTPEEESPVVGSELSVHAGDASVGASRAVVSGFLWSRLRVELVALGGELTDVRIRIGTIDAERNECLLVDDVRIEPG